MFNNNLPLALNEELRRNLIENFNFLYKRHTSLLRNLNMHKQYDKNAHTTEQITQGARNQKDINADLQSQLEHLAVAPRNNSENEIVQARVDILGNKYGSLKGHLIAWEERTKIMKEEVLQTVEDARKEILDIEYRFEPDKQEFLYVTDLSPLTNAVMQSFWIDNNDGTIYMTQAYNNYRITRLKPNGAYIDEMQIDGGGHGTHNGYRYINGKLWIYSHITDSEGKRKLVRFTYHPNKTLKYGTYDAEEVFTGHPENPYLTPIINQHTNEILFRIEYPRSEWDKRGSMNYIEIRDLDDVDNRIDKVKSKIDIPLRLTGADRPMQGVEFDEDNIYWYTGPSNTQVDNLLNAFDRKTGREKYEVEVNYGGSSGIYPGNFAEPEGMQVYYNKEGKKAMLLGVTVGGDGNRTHKIYAIAQRGVLDELKSRGTPVPLTDTGGKTKPLPLDPSKLRNLQKITEPGYYYLYTNHTKNLDDFPLPKNQRDAGWFFQVEPPQSNGDVLQRLVRNSYGRNMLTFERFVSGITDRNGVSPWNLVYKTAGYWERIPYTVKKIEDMNIVGMTYYLTSADTDRLVDFPKERAGYAGWILHVEQGQNGQYMHRLVRNSTTAPIEVLYRNYRGTDITSWYLYRPTEIK